MPKKNKEENIEEVAVVEETAKEETPIIEEAPVKKEIIEEAPVEAPVEVVVEESTMPIFEKVQVRYIMKDDRTTMTYFHCKMSDGTTRHVPKELFV